MTAGTVHRRGRAGERGETPRHHLSELPPIVIQIARLERVALEVARSRRGASISLKRPSRSALSGLQPNRSGYSDSVRLAVGGVFPAAHQAAQALAIARRRRQMQQIEDAGEHVGEADDGADARRKTPGARTISGTRSTLS